MNGALDIHRELLGRDIRHEIIRLPRVILQADELADLLGVDPDQVVTVRLFVADDQVIAVAVPSGRWPVTRSVLRATGARTLRDATAQEINESTRYAAGLVSPLLLPLDLPLFVDARLGRHDLLYTATGESGTALAIPTADLLVTSGARVADLTGVSLADSLDVPIDLEV